MEMASLGSWIIMAGWTIGLAILAWWFFMPNPMDRDKKPKKKP
jgi:FtsH-binding integral membrane protein